MSGPSWFNSLPDDIVIEIATQLRHGIDSSCNFSTFVLVSKRCHRLSLPVFYGNIALTDAGLDRFTMAFPAAYSKYIRSLTLYAGRNKIYKYEERIRTTAAFPQKLERLINVIKCSENLSCFSLRAGWGITVTCMSIIQLLKSLPEKCTNLELEIRGTDHRNDDGQTHVCDAIRDILPRMQHVRLGFGAMCCAMFGADETLVGGSSCTFVPVVLPALKSLTVNCGYDASGPLRPCGKKGPTTSSEKFEWSANQVWQSVTEGLAKCVEHNFENIKHSHVYAMLGVHGNDRQGTCAATIRVDMVVKEAWVLPSILLNLNNACIRLPSGVEVVTNSIEVREATVEGHLWKNVVGGVRLPADVLDAERMGLASFARGCVEEWLPAKTVSDWLLENPEGPDSTLWLKEQKVNNKLVVAERRTGDHYLSVQPASIKEISG